MHAIDRALRVLLIHYLYSRTTLEHASATYVLYGKALYAYGVRTVQGVRAVRGLLAPRIPNR